MNMKAGDILLFEAEDGISKLIWLKTFSKSFTILSLLKIPIEAV